MRLVDRPYARPHHCAALPYIGQTHASTRWIDTGSELPGFDNHVYLSSLAVEEAARLLGWSSPAENLTLQRQVKAARDEAEGLHAELAEARRQLEAVHVLKQAGFQAERKRGPKPREGAVA